MANEHFDTAIIGGGQAGLAAAYHVKQRGRTPVVLDENERVGDSWRTRWDSLRLFTPAQYDGLPGWRFSCTALVVPDEGRDGRLYGVIRSPLRTRRPYRRQD
jgi:cation diffusion facilitator CzcD-associated flavoprotein CzcO